MGRSGRAIHPFFAGTTTTAGIVTGQTTTPLEISFDIGPNRGGRGYITEVIFIVTAVNGIEISFVGGTEDFWFLLPGVPAGTHPRAVNIPCFTKSIWVRSNTGTADFTCLGITGQ